MPTPRLRSRLTAALIASAIGCAEGSASTAPDGPTPPGTPAATPPGAPTVAPPAAPTANRVRGRVTDTQGRPLAGVRIIVDNTLYFNTSVSTQTDGDGAYSVQVPAGSWRVLAKLTRGYNGRSYTFDLHPDDASSFAGGAGAVRNFQWRLTGDAPEYMGRAFYGGSVDLLLDPNGDFYDIENVEFTFTPDGPLVDGSAGRVIVARSGAARTPSFSKILDVPIGRYRVTARHVPPGGQARPVPIRVEGAPGYAGAAVAGFAPEGTACRNCMRLEINRP